MRLMAQKLSVAGLIEGQVTDEGLAAMGECEDLTSQLAKELALGLKSSGADIESSFKKMAILHKENDKPKQIVMPRIPITKTNAVQQLSFFDMPA